MAMRIGFLANTNNFPFMVARALRRLGEEVLFIVRRPELLNRPEFRSADIPLSYPSRIQGVGTVNPVGYVLPVQRVSDSCDS